MLAGRDDLLRDLDAMLVDVATAGRARARDVVLAGPRGIGKTVTLTVLGQKAATIGFEVVNLQAVAGRAGLVGSLLQEAAGRVAEQSGPWTRARRALDRVASVSLGVAGFSAGVSTHPGSGGDPDGANDVSPGALAGALASLSAEIRQDAPNGGLLVTVDEMQVASHGGLALLAATLHRLNVDQDLIDEGDVYSPQRGYLALAVPVFAPFVLAHYEEARQDAGTELLPLAALRERAAAAVAPRPLPEIGERDPGGT